LYLFLLAAGLLLVSGCTGKGNLRFNEPNNEDLFRISGKIAVAEIVETELSGSLRGSLTQINDFRTFSVTADEVTVTADESGHFTLNNVPVSEKMLLHARSGKLSF
jgi:Tol biopolymer transport system component